MKYALITGLMLLATSPYGSAQQSEYPMMEKVAQKVIEKYQKSSCEDLKAEKAQPPKAPNPQQAAMKQKAVAALKNESEDARAVP